MLRAFRLFFVLALPLGVAGTAAADNSCQYSRDGECDESRYGGTGACPAATDQTDCKLASSGNNTCRWAWDGQCDEPGLGTGSCALGTDATDCRALYAGGDDSCQWARDGECDETGIGTGACTDGTDLSDCRAVYSMRNRDNTCDTPFDGVCDEPETGSGRCLARTDTVDCLGRATVEGLRDHFFGHDDRQVVQPDHMPWSAIGELTFASGGSCSGTLVGRRVVLTAAHCFYLEDGTPDPPDRFRAGRDRSGQVARAGIASWFASPLYRHPDEIGPRGVDWAFVVLDADIGDAAGTMAIHRITPEDIERINAGEWMQLSQAGYPWDAPERMIAHVGCRAVKARPDDSILHECDMTKGDSGGPLFIKENGGFSIVGVVVQFFKETPGERSSYLAVDTRAFADALAKFVAANGG